MMTKEQLRNTLRNTLHWALVQPANAEHIPRELTFGEFGGSELGC